MERSSSIEFVCEEDGVSFEKVIEQAWIRELFSPDDGIFENIRANGVIFNSWPEPRRHSWTASRPFAAVSFLWQVSRAEMQHIHRYKGIHQWFIMFFFEYCESTSSGCWRGLMMMKTRTPKWIHKGETLSFTFVFSQCSRLLITLRCRRVMMSPCHMCILARNYIYCTTTVPVAMYCLHLAQVQWRLGRSRPPSTWSDAFDSVPEETCRHRTHRPQAPTDAYWLGCARWMNCEVLWVAGQWFCAGCVTSQKLTWGSCTQSKCGSTGAITKIVSRTSEPQR